MCPQFFYPTCLADAWCCVWGAVGAMGTRGAIAPPDFTRSVNPILALFLPPLPPRIFRPSSGPCQCMQMQFLYVRLKRNGKIPVLSRKKCVLTPKSLVCYFSIFTMYVHCTMFVSFYIYLGKLGTLMLR